MSEVYFWISKATSTLSIDWIIECRNCKLMWTELRLIKMNEHLINNYVYSSLWFFIFILPKNVIFLLNWIEMILWRIVWLLLKESFFENYNFIWNLKIIKNSRIKHSDRSVPVSKDFHNGSKTSINNYVFDQTINTRRCRKAF